jgi:hypothetical protein
MSAVLRLLNVLRVTPDYRPASQSTSHVFTVRLADKRCGLHFLSVNLLTSFLLCCLLREPSGEPTDDRLDIPPECPYVQLFCLVRAH